MSWLPGLPSFDLAQLADAAKLVVPPLGDYLLSTADPFTGGKFTQLHAITALVPWTRGVANLGLVAVVAWGSFHIMWAHGVRSLYTVRVLLPRLLLATVLINFSLPLVQAAIDVNNALCKTVVAMGIRLDAMSTFFTKDELSQVPTVPLLVTAALFFAYLVLLIAYLARFATLVILTIASPLAALLFILPDTHHWAREWGAAFVANLFMQPAQLLILGIGFQLEAGNHNLLRHGFALATVILAFKVRGALHTADRAGTQLIGLAKHMAQLASHVGHAR